MPTGDNCAAAKHFFIPFAKPTPTLAFEYNVKRGLLIHVNQNVGITEKHETRSRSPSCPHEKSILSGL